MKKFSILLLLCAFVFPACSLFDCSGNKKTQKPMGQLDSLPYTLSHDVVLSDTSKNMYMLGGVVNDSISSNVLIYNIPGNVYNSVTIPSLPKKLMAGFGFRLKDSLYYGGGYERNWLNSYTPVLDTHYTMKYVSSSVRIVSGESGRLYSCNNSDTLWSQKKLNTNMPVKALDFIGPTGWATSDSSVSKVFKTTNSGDNWDGGISIGNIKVYSLDFISADTGWAVGAEGKIFRTNNGGSTWDSVARKSFNNLNSIFFLNKKFGWACGESGRILRTTNCGSSWDTISSGVKNFNSICFKDSLVGYAVGDSGTVVKSTNGGASWSKVNKLQSSAKLRSVSMRSDTVIACGDRGNIIYTTDGNKWDRIYGVTPNNIYSVCFIAGSIRASLCGSNGFASVANTGTFRYTISNTFYALPLYNPSAGWFARANLPRPIAEVFSSAESLNDTLAYLVGGKTVGDTVLNSVYMYSKITGNWIRCTNLPMPRSYGGIAVTSDSMIVFFGGINSYNITDTIYKAVVHKGIGRPDSLTWVYSAKYPSGPRFAMATTGMKSIKGAFSIGGMTDVYSISNVLTSVNPCNNSVEEEDCTDAVNWLTHTGCRIQNYFPYYLEGRDIADILGMISTNTTDTPGDVSTGGLDTSIDDMPSDMELCLIQIFNNMMCSDRKLLLIAGNTNLNCRLIVPGGLGKGYNAMNVNQKIKLKIKIK